jgi:hypothetical protein
MTDQTDQTNAQIAGQIVTKAAEQAKVPEPIAQAAGEECEALMAAGKDWYKSKTIWTGVIAFGAMVIQLEFGAPVDPLYELGALAIVGVILRKLTKEPLK